MDTSSLHDVSSDVTLVMLVVSAAMLVVFAVMVLVVLAVMLVALAAMLVAMLVVLVAMLVVLAVMLVVLAVMLVVLVAMLMVFSAMLVVLAVMLVVLAAMLVVFAVMLVVFAVTLVLVSINSSPQWGAADAEIKVPSGEITELKRSPFKAWSKSVYSHTCYANCQGVLHCLFLTFQSIHLLFVPRSGELRTQKLKFHLVRTQSLNVLPLKPGVSPYIAIHATFTARDFFLAYFYTSGPFTCIFSKTSSDFSLCWLWLTHGSCVGPQNKIGHPA